MTGDAGAPAPSLGRRLHDMLVSTRRQLIGRATPAARYPAILPLAATGVPFFESSNGNAPRLAARLEGASVARQSTPIVPPAARVARIANATIAAGVVQLPDRTIVEESLINTSLLDNFGPFSRDGSGRIKRSKHAVKRRLRGGPYVLLKQRYDANYGHWLMEGLPRLSVVEDHVRLADCRFIVSANHGDMQRIYEDSLALFGIRQDQIVEVGDKTIEVDDLLYPTPLTCGPKYLAPRCIEVLEQIASRVRANPFGFDRIYVSRNRSKTRHLLNEAEIISIVESHGFIVVEPETLSLYQQIGLFRAARLVVGSCGAALTNAVFAGGDITLFALTTPLVPDDFLPTMIDLKQGRFLSQHGVASEPALGPDSNFTLDSALFEAILSTIL